MANEKMDMTLREKLNTFDWTKEDRHCRKCGCNIERFNQDDENGNNCPICND